MRDNETHRQHSRKGGNMKLKEAVMNGKVVELHCIQKGCPRKSKTTLDSFEPQRAEHIVQRCPWHLVEGGKDYPTLYFDKDWKEIPAEEIEAALNPTSPQTTMNRRKDNMNEETPTTKDNCLKALECLYVAVDASVATDVKRSVLNFTEELEQQISDLKAEIERLTEPKF